MLRNSYFLLAVTIWRRNQKTNPRGAVIIDIIGPYLAIKISEEVNDLKNDAISINPHYRVVVSGSFVENQSSPFSLRQLHGLKIILPEK
jgi:hypothetical protein